MALNVFLDSSFLVALFSQNEIYYPVAKKISRHLSDYQLYIDQVIRFETINVTLRKWGTAKAKYLDHWLKTNTVIIDITEEIWESALKQVISNYSRSGPNLFDHLHFACMTSYSLNNVLTFDKHFSKQGFKILK